MDRSEPEEAHCDVCQQPLAGTPDVEDANEKPECSIERSDATSEQTQVMFNQEKYITENTSLPDGEAASGHDDWELSSLAVAVAQARAYGQPAPQETLPPPYVTSPYRAPAATTPREQAPVQSDRQRAPIAQMDTSETAPGSDGDSDEYAGSEDDIPAVLPRRHAARSKPLFTKARFIPNTIRDVQPTREATHTPPWKMGTNASSYSVGRLSGSWTSDEKSYM